jgi:hypothetical protein
MIVMSTKHLTFKSIFILSYLVIQCLSDNRKMYVYLYAFSLSLFLFANDKGGEDLFL